MNAICERVIGTIRRECLDWLTPLSESHLRFILKSWIAHYNGGRPHMALGPGVPDPPATTKVFWRLPACDRVIADYNTPEHELQRDSDGPSADRQSSEWDA
jgi:hypothetical protein